ncbi:unnamed protein product [Psylliodes chrysocephalus]|uniref:BESS domain-containing protein n=1 Tax=Psylliodes chrysocephalus TaxID=3402493 RepID=A0A9P0D0P4_9CUCU|nr:unnamed protein product [Psylliodes chrysocephala]
MKEVRYNVLHESQEENIDSTENTMEEESAPTTQLDENNTNISKNISTETSTLKQKEFISPQKNLSQKRRFTADDLKVLEPFSFLRNKAAASNKPKDECKIFGEFVAEKLRKLNNQLRAQRQHKIGNILFKLDMSQYSFPVDQHQYPQLT